jgi:hypothetical protein
MTRLNFVLDRAGEPGRRALMKVLKEKHRAVRRFGNEVDGKLRNAVQAHPKTAAAIGAGATVGTGVGSYHMLKRAQEEEERKKNPLNNLLSMFSGK